MPESRGPEADLQMWQEAEEHLEYLTNRSDHQDNPCLTSALTDAYNRCIEERRRAEDLLKLNEKWSSRRIGGVVEPAEQ